MSEEASIAPAADRVAGKLASTSRPYVTLKAAATLDGKIAMRTGESRWITGDAARAHAHRLRAGHDAVLVGRGTVQADDPALTVRVPGLSAQPARVVLASRGEIAPDARVLAADGATCYVVVGNAVAQEQCRRLEQRGAQVIVCPTPRPRAEAYLPLLRAAGLRTVLVEGGAAVHADLIAHDAADELFLYLAGRVIGDPAAPGWCGELGVSRLDATPRVTLEPPRAIGADVLLHGWFG